MVGTAAYLAPEQVRGEEATPATDVYALGVVLYQFLTGRLPYEGSTLAELAVRQQNERPLPPTTYNDEVPGTLGPRCSAHSRATRRAATRAPTSSRADAAGLQGEDVTLLLEEGATATRVLGGETATAAPRPAREQTEFRPPPSRPDAPRPPRPAPVPPPPSPGAEPRKRGAFSRFVRLVLATCRPRADRGCSRTAVIVATDRATGVRAREVAGDTVDRVVEELRTGFEEHRIGVGRGRHGSTGAWAGAGTGRSARRPLPGGGASMARPTLE